MIILHLILLLRIIMSNIMITCPFQWVFLNFIGINKCLIFNMSCSNYLVIIFPHLFARDIKLFSLWIKYIRQSNMFIIFYLRDIFPGVLSPFPIWTDSSISLKKYSHSSISLYPFPCNFLNVTPVLNFYILDVFSFVSLTHFEHILPI